jgi:hypothetical protein
MTWTGKTLISGGEGVSRKLCSFKILGFHIGINPLTPELNPSAQRRLTRFFTGDFAS